MLSGTDIATTSTGGGDRSSQGFVLGTNCSNCLMDRLHGYSMFRLITGQIEDNEIPDRIAAMIAMIPRSGILNCVRADKHRPIKQIG